MSKFRRRFAVIGIGPAGLVAAHTISSLGYKFDLFSNSDKPSQIHGCQYLHEPIVGTNAHSTMVRYSLLGTPEKYREKVYGNAWTGTVSPEDFEGTHPAWDLRETYQRLWNMYIGEGHKETAPFQFDANPDTMSKVMVHRLDTYDAIFSTVPAPSVCLYPLEHQFKSHDIYAVGDKVEDGEVKRSIASSLLFENHNDKVICNGASSPAWYRLSRVFGVSTLEWPGQIEKPPFEGVVTVRKPLETNCDCHPWVTRIGRYGAWKKGYLVHQVVEDVRNKIEEVLSEG
jgi:hypothetical protein